MPDHPFELLGEQRFQQFCQALIALTFPDVQCLPVAQPDGGRDAQVRLGSKDSIIFQVKFARSPTTLQNPSAWIESVLKKEKTKIENLVQRGASKYTLITNFSPTAHLDTGSIDQVQKAIDELPIPADCWWRDDLNRRLEGAFDVKLSYPELLTGPDLLRILAAHGQDNDAELRRQRAIKAYLVEQYLGDREVRFRQADLANELLKFFIDVPATPLVEGKEAQHVRRFISELNYKEETPVEVRQERPDPLTHGAAGLLLYGEFQKLAPYGVIEGAPGQGKSTMLQYICQVHRMRILEKEEAAEVDPVHRVSPQRLPFKIDLRDFAVWLRRRHRDIQAEPADAPPAALEEFLAAEVERSSGGSKFDVADLQAVISKTSGLLALDGLDEVGDTQMREEVVEAIDMAVARLAELCPSLQAIVTTRPASFGGRPVFSRVKFKTIRLRSLETPLIKDYGRKWVDARRVGHQAGVELIETLEEKLREPHIRDIAQNPMQLAILLDLVHRRGQALPDQRTALYNSYMDLFLDREAEKSEVVLKYRPLLLSLHGYLAWLLHCQAESPEGDGRFTFTEVEERVAKFLEGRGFPADLFGDLFAGVFDRVGALVSRYQGTFEFEVQPLREFFTARFLYESAAHSTPGDRRSGTRPERFDAIAQRPYWLNVTRFYAGSYNSGELASIADRLEALDEDRSLGTTTHPRAVATRLLADRTFQQDIRIQRRVVELVCEDIPDRGGASEATSAYVPSTMLSLPADCGGKELAEVAWASLSLEERIDRRAALAAMIRAQVPAAAGRRERFRALNDELDLEGRRRLYLSIGDLRLGKVLSQGEVEIGPASVATCEALLVGGQFSVFDTEEGAQRRARELVLSKPEIVSPEALPTHPLSALASVLMTNPQQPLLSRSRQAEIKKAFETNLPEYEAIREFIGDVDGWGSPDHLKRFSDWEQFIERGRSVLGDSAGLHDLALSATGIADPGERIVAQGELLDDSIALSRRFHQARLRGGDHRWWAEQLTIAESEDERLTVVALAWCWASEDTLMRTYEQLVQAQASLSSRFRERLVTVIARCLLGSPPAHRRSFRRTRWLGRVDSMTFACVHSRLPRRNAQYVYLRSRPFEDEQAGAVLDLLAAQELEALADPPASYKPPRAAPGGSWEEAASLLRRRADADIASTWRPRRGLVYRDLPAMPADLALKIVEEARRYPLGVVALGEERRMKAVQIELEGVANVAAEGDWFAYGS